jgi:hypothetical protein
LKRSCKNRVNKILEDAIVEVSDAPILSRPTTYSNAAARGNREKDIKYIHSGIVGIDVSDVDKIRIVAKINPEIRSEAPVTSIEVCLLTNLVIAITPPAKANAESIASKSPKVMTNGNIELKSNERLETVAKNPNNAIITPTSCIFRSFSSSSNHASINTTIVSKGPAKRPSFEAPTLVTESYHKNTAAARNIEPTSNNFHELNTVIFFERTVEMKSNVAPANGILMPATNREEIPGISVKSSTIIDSNERVIA